MTSLFTRVKSRLSHVDQNAWHYKAFSQVWSRKANSYIRKKACTYYWFYLPTSLLIIAVVAIFVVFAWVIGLFFGHFPKFNDEPGTPGNELFYPYRQTKSGRTIPLAPWEAVIVLALLYGAYRLAVSLFDNPSMLKLPGIVVLALIALGGFIYLFLKGWSTPPMREARGVAGHSITSVWDKVCPTLVVVEPKIADETSDVA